MGTIFRKPKRVLEKNWLPGLQMAVEIWRTIQTQSKWKIKGGFRSIAHTARCICVDSLYPYPLINLAIFPANSYTSDSENTNMLPLTEGK